MPYRSAKSQRKLNRKHADEPIISWGMFSEGSKYPVDIYRARDEREAKAYAKRKHIDGSGLKIEKW
jgi:hypothetical protein